MRTRNFKGNLGDFAIAGLICSVFLAAMIMAFGGIAVNNHLPLPGPVNALYQALNASGGLRGTSFTQNQTALMNTTTGAANQEQSSGFFSTLTNGFNSVGVVLNFLWKVPSLFISFFGFITGALSIVGIPTTMVTMVAGAIMLLTLVLIILSALFIFPLIRGS